MSGETDSRAWRKILEEAVRRQRAHAGFFHWYDRSPAGKAVTEWGAVSTLFEAMQRTGGCPYSDLIPTALDVRHPDCEAVNTRGERVAIEVTELVDETAVAEAERAKRGMGEYRPRAWPEPKIVARLQDRISEKDCRQAGPGYAGSILVVHTAEPELSLLASRVIDLVAAREFQFEHGNLTRAFLLLDYDGAGYPFTELRLGHPWR